MAKTVNRAGWITRRMVGDRDNSSAGAEGDEGVARLDRTNADRDRIIRTKLGGAPYVSLELFAVPPRKLLAKAGVRR